MFGRGHKHFEYACGLSTRYPAVSYCFLTSSRYMNLSTRKPNATYHAHEPEIILI